MYTGRYLMRFKMRVWIAMATTGFASACLAQQPVFMTPDAFLLSAPTAKLGLRMGQGINSSELSWSNLPVRWIFVKTGQVQENRDSAAEWQTPGGGLTVPIPAAGAVMIGADFLPTRESATGTSLMRLMPDRKLEASRAYTIRHYRSATTLMRTVWPKADNESGAAIPTSEAGLKGFIHPLFDPTRLMLGGDLAFEVTSEGKEVERGIIAATHVSTGTVVSISFEAGKLARFYPTLAGVWQLATQIARPLSNDPRAQFEVISATLTFSIPERKSARL